MKFLIQTGTAFLMATGIAYAEQSSSQVVEDINLSREVTATTIISVKGGEYQSGTNIGGGNEAIGFMANWCQDAVTTLNVYKESARMSVYRGDYHTANDTLTQGLVAALQKNDYQGKTLFTYKALARGLELAGFLSVGDLYKTPYQKEATYRLLLGYYNFVLNSVARDLDFKVYLPLLNCVNCDMDTGEFERRFVDYAVKQLQHVQNSLVTTKYRDGYWEAIPTGPSSYYLKVMEVLSHYTANDLQNSLWNQRFSCVIGNLRALNHKLQQYNQGSTSLYSDDRIAVNVVWNNVKKIMDEIYKETSCY